MSAPVRSVAVVGAGDFIGASIVRKFAGQGFAVHAGRRNGDKLAPLLAVFKDSGLHRLQAARPQLGHGLGHGAGAARRGPGCWT